jgi:hypothetical protein
MKDRTTVRLMSNGMTSAFRNEEQIAELQESWLLLYVRFVEGLGIDPNTLDITLPTGMAAKLVKSEQGLNYQVS